MINIQSIEIKDKLMRNLKDHTYHILLLVWLNPYN
jgi:hypothetical protein